MTVPLSPRERQRLSEELKQRGWWFDGPNGGWMHDDLRNDDGMLMPLGTVEEAWRYSDIDVEA